MSTLEALKEGTDALMGYVLHAEANHTPPLSNGGVPTVPHQRDGLHLADSVGKVQDQHGVGIVEINEALNPRDDINRRPHPTGPRSAPPLSPPTV